jgi:hypothetical protein
MHRIELHHVLLHNCCFTCSEEKKAQPAAAQQPDEHALLITFCARLYSSLTSTAHTVHIRALATISKLGTREFFMKMGDISKEAVNTLEPVKKYIHKNLTFCNNFIIIGRGQCFICHKVKLFNIKVRNVVIAA